jgi:EEF1A lysine methyltransferase 4
LSDGSIDKGTAIINSNKRLYSKHETAVSFNLEFAKMMNIGDTAYWDARYKKDLDEKMGQFELFDWYTPFNDLYTMIKQFFDESIVHKILVIGVGRSNIIENLYRQGFRDITAIDISPTIIDEMQRKHEAFPGVEFFVMDVKQLYKFSNDTFTIVFDKGCIDSLFCGTDYFEASRLAFQEIYRVLKPNGQFLLITHAPPVARVPYLRFIHWALELYKVPNNIGENLSLFLITKTDNEELIAKKIIGGEVPLIQRTSMIATGEEGQPKKTGGGTNKSGKNTGMITVTGSIDFLAELVAESAVNDG